MIRLTQFSVRQRSVTVLLAVAFFLAGIVSWGQLRQELLPDIELPFVSVIAQLPGAGAEDVVTQLTEPIERVVGNVPRLEQMQSTSANSLSLVFAQFSFGTDIKETLATINQQLAQAALPEGVRPQVSAFNLNDQPVIVASIGPAEGADPVEAARLARTVVLPEVRGIEGVSSADLTGGPTPVVRITLDPASMADNGIALGQVTGLLMANQTAIPSGAIEANGLRLPVSTEHRFASIEEVEGLIVGVRGMGGGDAAAGDGGLLGGIPLPVTLGSIAAIEQVDVQASGYSRTNGAPSLTLTVSKSAGANTVEVADAAQAAFEDIEARYPEALSIETIQDLSVFIKESRDGLVFKGMVGAIFAILTIFVFLLSLRSTLVAAISIPLSIMVAIALFGPAGISANIITLGGLAVAVGRVVDDAIVVLENIYRHRARGEAIGEAVMSGTREVAGAITSSTLTTVAVFLPIGFVGGIVSQFFLPFGLAVTFSLLASLVVALTVVPVLAFFLVRKVDVRIDRQGELPETIWQRLYTPALTLALRSRLTKWGTLGIALVLFVGSMALAPLLPTAFIDAGGEKFLAVTIAPPQGVSSQGVRERAEEAERIVLARDDVEVVQSTIPGDTAGGAQVLQSAFAGRASNSALLTVRLAESADTRIVRDELADDLEPMASDGYTVAVAERDGFGGGGFSLILSGEDRADIRRASDALVADLVGVDGLANVASDLVAAAPQVRVAVQPNRAVLIGMTTAQVAGEIRNVLVGQPVGTLALADGGAAQLLVRVDGGSLESIEGLRRLPIAGMRGMAPLGDIATVEQVEVQGSVTRVNGAPAATVSASFTTQDQGAVAAEAQEVIDGLRESGAIPASVTTTFSGSTAQQREAFGSLFFSMAVAVLVVYIVMVLALGSLISPFIILFSLPLATIGAIPALLITGRPLGVSALIGFLMLIGIVVTNAIVLLDFVEQLRARGLRTQEALIQGARVRVRPILMTAVATILALTPVAMGITKGSIIAAELGTVVIGGLFSSTFLTLIVVPVIYSLVDGAKTAASRRLRLDVEEWSAVQEQRPAAATE
jgi:hydrophobic/amphiphilic exporter-1 (mainly G- bacteria), HAE1 family